MYVILNTGDIIQRYLAYDSLFGFYENGIKDLVREATFLSNRRHRDHMSDFHSELYWGSSLAGRAVRDWERAVDVALDDRPDDVRNYLQGQNKLDCELIQMVVEQIEEEIDSMILNLTKDPHYRVTELSSTRYSHWVGNDLVVEITSRQPED